MSSRDYLTIGEVVQRLEPQYPDLSISKLRFLEEEGLVTPDRTAGGYRKFTNADVMRLEMVLRMQKEHFLPLAVIRERLADFDRGKVPPEMQAHGVAEQLPLAIAEEGPLPVEDAPSALGIPMSFLRELDEFGLIGVEKNEDGVEQVERPDVSVIHAAWDLRKFGVEPRHLRMYVMFADREAALFSQILTPAFKHKTPESRKQLSDTLAELGGLTDQLKGRLLRRALGRAFKDLV